MKKTFFTCCFVLIAFFMATETFAQKQGPEKTRVLLVDDSTQVLSYPMDVMSIITNKCLGCHSPNARGDKSKQALQWVLLQNMTGADLVAKLDEVVEVLEEGEMPPAKMLERFPMMKLTDDEVAILKEWAESSLNSAMGE